MRHIEGHHDFGLLEARLVDLIRGMRAGEDADPFAPIAVVAPTRWLITHLRTVLAEAFPGLVSVVLLHHGALARGALSAAGKIAPRTLSTPVREQILARALAGSGGELARYAARRPGAVGALLATISDLRESGIGAGAAHTAGITPRGREVLRLYDAYRARLEDLRSAGLADRSGTLVAALPYVRDYARRFRLVIHYGAYELIGINLALMKAVEESAGRVIYLVPSHPHSVAHEHARAFWKEMLNAVPAPLAEAPGNLSGHGAKTDTGPEQPPDHRHLLSDRLPFLYDDTREPPAPSPGSVHLFHAQGAGAELREVVLRILALREKSGVTLDRIAVIARSLEPYACHLRPVFEEHGLPFTTTATLGALREARVQAVHDLVRTVLDDYPRQSLIDLCRSGMLRTGGPDPLRYAAAWDRLSREFGVPGGLTAWTSDLPQWVEAHEPFSADHPDPEAAVRYRKFREVLLDRALTLASTVRRLHGVSRPLRDARSFDGWADAMEALIARMLPPDASPDSAGAPAEDLLVGLLSDLRDLGRAGLPFHRAAARTFFESALRGASLTISPAPEPAGGDFSSEPCGVRVLDAMQARGLSFDAVFLIGFNADLIPRRPVEDPFLGDPDRRLLRARFRAPLPLKSAGRSEERLLLAHLLGAARRHLTISWQHADEGGRARIPSLALREVARACLGSAEQDLAIERAVRVTGHPASAGRQAARVHGLLSPLEASIGAALELGSPGAVRRAATRLPLPDGIDPCGALDAGLAMLDIVEDFDGRDLSYDASIGDAVPSPPNWSPSRLEQLGVCPQRYYFRHVLGVDELREVSGRHEIEARELGTIVHEVLRDVYRELADAGDLAGDPVAAVTRAHDLADAAWHRHAKTVEQRMRPLYPVLWRNLSTLWRASLHRFLSWDVEALARDGAHVIGLESGAEVLVDLGPYGGALPLRGRFDRVTLRGERELLVTDYKSSGHLENYVDLAAGLKGRRLQLPLYILMTESLHAGRHPSGVRAGAEVIGIGPSFAVGEDRFPLDADRFEQVRSGFLETLSVLRDLAAAGHYPLNDETPFACRSCPYTAACRRSHTPTRERLTTATPGAAYALLAGKNTRRPLLTPAGSDDGEKR